MPLSDNEDFRSRFIEEFKKIDATYDTFRQEFDAEVRGIIRVHYPGFRSSAEFDELLGQFATAALSIAHSVIDRDATYPDFRIKDDLTALQSYYARAAASTANQAMSDQIHKKTKELVVKYLPRIIDLSADGFRLMEMNLKLFNLEFSATVRNLQK